MSDRARREPQDSVGVARGRAPRVWAEVDLGNLARNLTSIQSALPQATRIMVVVKADAYGHGAVPIAWTALRHGAYALGVGNSSEAIELREAGVTAPILILGAIIEGEVGAVVGYGISCCIHSASRVDILEREARRQGRRAKVHLLVDTGMRRLGAKLEDARELLHRIRDNPAELQLEGIATHFADSGAEDEAGMTLDQEFRFLEALDIDPEADRDYLLHSSNSGAIFMDEVKAFDMVRPGIATYGIHTSAIPSNVRLHPVLSLRSQIIFLKDVPAGSPIGYGGRFVTERRTRVATVPVGYHDGYAWRLGGRAEALVRGRRVPVIGSVTMDYLMLDVTDVVPVLVGDTVTLIGADGDECISALDMANWAGTIPYEITCSLGTRVKRVYVGGEG